MTECRPTSAELLSFPAAEILPDSLVPPHVDLRDFPYMPMEVERLFGSEFHAQTTDAEWRAGVTLWLKSFHQVPAASLPDDDVALARLAELGRDVRSWRRVKSGALRGWVRCRMADSIIASSLRRLSRHGSKSWAKGNLAASRMQNGGVASSILLLSISS
jgi:hypothetical protein